MSDASAFSPDYLAARARFRSAAIALGCTLEEHPIGDYGATHAEAPDGSPLTVDVARMGTAEPERVVVVSSGLHGVEGFFGSAVQAALLEDHLGGWSPPYGFGLVLVHALNPYGFAWSRRVDGDNVDLNRNFLLPGQPYSGSPDGYAALDGLLNPRRPPRRRGSLFLPKALATIARHGMPALKNAVAGGQYDFPLGLFFGGSGPSATQRLLDEQLPRWVGAARKVLHVDFHTGLGRSGTYKLLVDHPWGASETVALEALFGDVVQPWEPEEGVSYEIRGGLGQWCKARFPEAEYDVLAAEFGTVSILQVIAALHHENRVHHWGDPADAVGRDAKARLRDVFAPPERAWRDAVVPKGVRVVQRAIDALC